LTRKDQGGNRCGGCGLSITEGTEGCQALFDELLGRDFQNVLYFRMHRMLVDVYALQHPDRYCASAKSLAAHLTGLCWFMDHEGSRAVGSEVLRKWLDGPSPVRKPALPESRGSMTIDDVRHEEDPDSYAEAVNRWARATWEAYAPLHDLAREWIRMAQAGKKEPPER